MRKTQKIKYTYTTLDKFEIELRKLDPLTIINENPEGLDIFYGDNYVFTDNQGNIKLVTKEYDTEKQTLVKKKLAVNGYIWDDEEYAKEKTREQNVGVGARAISRLKRISHKYNEDFEYSRNEEFGDTTKCTGFEYCNEEYQFKKVKVWSYDMHSCYPYFMTKPLPYGDELGPGLVETGEVGFNLDEDIFDGLYEIKKVNLGDFAQFRFKTKIYDTFIEFANEGYAKKYKDKKYKKEYNATIGAMKYHHVFIRACVLNYAEEYMKSLIDNDTIMCTVDSIVSLKPRPDLNVGEGLGQFAIEHENEYFVFQSCAIKMFYDTEQKHAGIGKYRYIDIDLYWNKPRIAYDPINNEIYKTDAEPINYFSDIMEL